MGTRARQATTAERRARPLRHRVIGALLAGALVAGACSGDDATPGTSTTSTAATDPTRPSVPTTGPTDPTGPGTGDPNEGDRPLIAATSLRLSQGQALTAAAPIPLVTGAPLDDAAIRAVIERLPGWGAEEPLAQPFAWPAQTLAAPITGATLDEPFPPTTDPGALPSTPTGPLQVLRYQPEGDVAIAPFVSITFDRPMVPVTTVGQLAADEVPATISPALPGRWQWIGTRTLRFDAAADIAAGEPDRLPMATTYTVEVPAGTTSATGDELPEALRWQFTTPPARVQSFSPSDAAGASTSSLPLTPVFVATFDQHVDPAAVLATVTVSADGEPHAVRLATPPEIDADEHARATTSWWPEGRWVAFRAVDPFAPGSALRIEIGPAVPSAEGPLTDDTVATFTAHTYRPLEVGAITCGYGDRCAPGTSLEIGLNNAIDPDLFDPATVRVEPPIDGMVVGTSWSGISVWGATAPNTTYTVTIPAGLTDVFGQQLAEDASRTISIGAAVPMLQPFAQPMITVDPLAGEPSVSVVSVGHERLRVRIFGVQPTDWSAFEGYFMEQMGGRGAEPPFPELLDTTVVVEADVEADVDADADAAVGPDGGDHDRITETSIPLGDVLDGPGSVVVRIEPIEPQPEGSEQFWQNRPTVAWVQATALGVDVFGDTDEVRAWVTDLTTGAPVPGASVRLAGHTAVSVTDRDGLATLPLTSEASPAVIVTVGDDTAFVPSGYYGSGGWVRVGGTDAALTYVLDDRGTYRPGETVSVKGWARRWTTAADAQVVRLDDGATVQYAAHDAQGNEIASGTAELSPLGGFDFELEIPAGANLGPAWLVVTLAGSAAGLAPALWQPHTFQIQEFRRPEFEVSARPESPGPAIVGEPLTVAVDASYYAGGPLGASPVEWQVTTSPASYSPPGWDEFTFGRWTPWWVWSAERGGRGLAGAFDTGAFDADVCCWTDAGAEVATFSGTTDVDGSHYLRIDVPRLEGDLDEQPVTVTSQANVTDVNRQSIAATTNVLVHPSAVYVGVASERTFVREGEPLDVDVIVTDIDGAVVPGVAVAVTASRTTTTFRNGRWTQEQVDPQVCELTSATEVVSCSFTTATGGTYSIEADVVDGAGRGNHSELTRWVSGGDAVPRRNVEADSLTIVPDVAEYAPGQRAELLVQSPIDEGEGLAVVTRNGIRSTIRFTVTGGSAVVTVPISEGDVPSLGVHLEVVGTSPRVADDGTPMPDAPERPAYATGSIVLPVSVASRTLAVTASVATDPVEPGVTTAVDVTVTGPDGQPVAGAELAVVVVDEAVLALSAYELRDPLATFYAQVPTQLTSVHGRSTIVLTRPEDVAARVSGEESATGDTTSAPAATIPAAGAPGDNSAGGGDGADFDTVARDDSGQGPGTGVPSGGTIGVRTNFDALAVFEPEVSTDVDGRARVDVPLPDNLTRYRVMVVAVHGDDRFGSAETTLTARLPLMVRPSAPRFLNFGDEFELPVVVQNQTGAPMQVDVVLQVDNLAIAGPAGVRVSVPADERVEVRFPVATVAAGTAHFRVAVVSSAAADAATVELPVYTPATAEAFATYGVIDDGAISQPVAAPVDVIPEFGGLEVTTSSTSLQTLTDAVLYLEDYPYRSSDALASRIMAIAALRDVLDAFDAEGLPSPPELDARTQADVDALVALQNFDGGFAYWQLGRPSDPYTTTQATHALELAASNGYRVPQQTLALAREFLRNVEAHIPSHYGPDARAAIRAYALHVRMLAGDRDTSKARDVYGDGRLPLDALAWLWPVVDDPAITAQIERTFQNRAVDTAGAATFTSDADDSDHLVLRSDRRTDGLVLDALIRLRPDSDLIPKVVAGLLGNRNAGRWDSVQENAFILLALHRYFETYEAQTPDFVARVWLGGRFAGEHEFVGRSTDRSRINVPTEVVIGGGDGDLVIGKQGTGRLYYRIGMRTAPADPQLEPLDRGFVVERTYEAVDDPADVTRDADGRWHVRAGARVRVRLTMVAESQRTHAALVDALPAGFEILNPSLATSADVPEEDGADPAAQAHDAWWWTTWFDHQNMRDDRAEAFATWLPAGTYDYSYVATATTPGTFVVPPTRAEEMYAPETFGRGATDTVVIG